MKFIVNIYCHTTLYQLVSNLKKSPINKKRAYSLTYGFADERKKLFESVDLDWEKRQKRMMARAANPINFLSGSDNEECEYDITEDIEECITRGKSITLCSFMRTAKNTMTLHFGKIQQPPPEEVLI